jgi:hypothetical protein
VPFSAAVRPEPKLDVTSRTAVHFPLRTGQEVAVKFATHDELPD